MEQIKIKISKEALDNIIKRKQAHINILAKKYRDFPEIGEIYNFFDEGKPVPSRCYEAKVTDIIPYNQEYIVNAWDDIYEYEMPKTLQELQKENHEDNPGLYAKTTDFFIGASIPEYDEFTIWFVRTTDGGWFSMDVEHPWQSGELDVDGSIYERNKKAFEEFTPTRCYDEYNHRNIMGLTQKGFSNK